MEDQPAHQGGGGFTTCYDEHCCVGDNFVLAHASFVFMPQDMTNEILPVSLLYQSFERLNLRISILQPPRARNSGHSR